MNIKVGDGLVGSVVLLLVVVLFVRVYFVQPRQTDQPRRVCIRQAGRVVQTVLLPFYGTVRIQGPLGSSVVEFAAYRVRVASDPGPRQYCVQQGWLSHAGEIAICAPNLVTVEMVQTVYDEIAY